DEPDRCPRQARLAAPRFADETDDLSTLDRQARPGDGAEAPAAGPVVLDDDVAEVERAHRGTSGSTGHARRRPLTVTSGGTCSAHDSTANRQRGWNAQPGGTRAGLGGAPPIATSRCSRAPSGCGSASSRARVYGCRGRCSTASRVPDSTTRPA